MTKGNPLLKVEDLSISILSKSGEKSLTQKVSFELHEGEILALVGESGSGKSISSMTCLGWLPQPGGHIVGGKVCFEGVDLWDGSDCLENQNLKAWQQIRGNQIALISQEPSQSLNPLVRIEKQLMEVFKIHKLKADRAWVIELLYKVGLCKEPSDEKRILRSYPWELSGGMQQRVAIAMALILRPKLLIADEPTTALDVSVQSQILELLEELQKEMKLGVLFITHNLGLVARLADRLVVMQNGQVVESSTVESFFEAPQMEYSKALLEAVPRLPVRK